MTPTDEKSKFAPLTPLECARAIMTMEEYGGAFTKALAAAYRVADPENRTKIEATWEDSFRWYGRVTPGWSDENPTDIEKALRKTFSKPG